MFEWLILVLLCTQIEVVMFVLKSAEVNEQWRIQVDALLERLRTFPVIFDINAFYQILSRSIPWFRSWNL
jgi:hypothetical protein